MSSYYTPSDDPEVRKAALTEEIQSLLESVPRSIAAFKSAPLSQERLRTAASRLPSTIASLAYQVATEVISSLRFSDPKPPKHWEYESFLIMARDALVAQQRFLADPQALFDRICNTVGYTLSGFQGLKLPEPGTQSLFTVPLWTFLKDPRATIDGIRESLDSLGQQDGSRLLLAAVSMEVNQQWVAGKPLTALRSTLSTEEVVDTYVKYTPYGRLFMAPIPLVITQDDRFNHTHIVGGTGAGKTTLIENLIASDLQSADPPSIVVIDPHSDLIKKLTSRDLGLGDRLIVIDPRDVEYPPALNVFAQNRGRLGQYDMATREQVTAGVIQTFDYLFTGLVGADLTAKQSTFFRYMARLLLSMPQTMGRNATILDMMHLMNDTGPYRVAINALDPIPREFFERDFMSKTFQQTKEQIRYRIQALIENPTLARLFTSPETKIDLFTEMNRGAVILVDTAKDFLKDGSANFGRIFISLVLQAVLERSAIPDQERKPTFLIVDEAASFFDQNIDDLLTEVRKYKCGVVLAHQHLGQALSPLQSSLAANTGIKFASGLSAGDARALAHDMRTQADFIMAQPKLQFAAYIRNRTPNAVSIPVKPGVLDAFPLLSEEALAAHRVRNRARVSLAAQLPTTVTDYPMAAEAAATFQGQREEW